MVCLNQRLEEFQGCEIVVNNYGVILEPMPMPFPIIYYNGSNVPRYIELNKTSLILLSGYPTIQQY